MGTYGGVEVLFRTLCTSELVEVRDQLNASAVLQKQTQVPFGWGAE
jgi:hypothetical protein